jgi:hypothetical protein
LQAIQRGGIAFTPLNQQAGHVLPRDHCRFVFCHGEQL